MKAVKVKVHKNYYAVVMTLLFSETKKEIQGGESDLRMCYKRLGQCKQRQNRDFESGKMRGGKERERWKTGGGGKTGNMNR